MGLPGVTATSEWPAGLRALAPQALAHTTTTLWQEYSRKPVTKALTLKYTPSPAASHQREHSDTPTFLTTFGGAGHCVRDAISSIDTTPQIMHNLDIDTLNDDQTATPTPPTTVGQQDTRTFEAHQSHVRSKHTSGRPTTTDRARLALESCTLPGSNSRRYIGALNHGSHRTAATG